jgi:hypothetical protein
MNLTAEVKTEITNWSECLAMAKTLQIESIEDFERASEFVKAARSQWKRVDERRQAITKPMLDAKRGVDKLFEPILALLKSIETELKAKIGAFTQKQEAAQIQAMQLSAAQYAAGGTPTAIIPEVPHAKGVSVKSVWRFRVTEPDRVPRHLCSPDPTKIEAEIWYADTPKTPPRPIPGIEFELETDVVVRVR